MIENKSFIGISEINNVLDVVINEIEKGKDKILDITQNLKYENEANKKELEEIDLKITKIIDKVNELEKIDKKMRMVLAEVSMGFNDKEIEIAYKNAFDVRVQYLTLQNEEKRLQNYRRSLQLMVKNGHRNIEQATSVIEQVRVAMNYLTGSISEGLENIEVDNKYSLGIKIVEAQEKEKNRISRDIHDGPAQYLASTLMRLDLCKTRLIQNVDEGLEELEDVKSNVKKTLKEVRNIIFDLRPPFFEEITFYEAIEDLKEAFEDECDIQLRMTYINDGLTIPVAIETAVYRVIQELLTNIKKHSKAKNAYLRVEVSKLHISFIVRDDGVGFDTNEVLENCKKNSKHYGLLGIFERIDELGGNIEAKSVDKYGTEYKVKVPINKEENK